MFIRNFIRAMLRMGKDLRLNQTCIERQRERKKKIRRVRKRESMQQIALKSVSYINI